MRLRFGDYIIEARLNLYKIPHHKVVGLTNRCLDNSFLLFADYDAVEDSVVIEDAELCQKKFKLGTALIRMSSPQYKKPNGTLVANYHLIFFVKLPYRQIKKMLKHLRCDNAFARHRGFQQRCNVLRLTSKGEKKAPIFYTMMPSSTHLEASKCHKTFFEVLDKVNIKGLKCLDKSVPNEVELINYVT
jgi:hypothetical protein